MPNFTYRPLSGFYKGSFANQLSDFTKINNSFLELSKDIPNLDSRISTLEANGVGIFSTGNFATNSIQGSILADNSVPGSKISNNSITGSQIVLNSVHGIVDANISSDANISASKINVGQIDHASIKNIGANTHAQIDTALSQLFHDVGSSVGVPLGVPLETQVVANAAQMVTLQTNLSTLNTYVNPAHLGTVAQTVSAAINEIVVDLQEVGASGLGVAGPVSSTIGALAPWGDTAGKILTNSSIIHNSSTLTTTFPGSIELSNPGAHLATAAQPFQSLNAVDIRLQSGADGGSIYGSGTSISLLPGDASTSVNIVTSTGTDTFNVSGLVMDVNQPIYTRVINNKPGFDLDVVTDINHSLNLTGGSHVTVSATGATGVASLQSVFVNATNNNSAGLTVDNVDAVSVLNPQNNGFLVLASNTGNVIRTSGQPINITTLGANNLGTGGSIELSVDHSANIYFNTGNGISTINDTEFQWEDGVSSTFTANNNELYWSNGSTTFISNPSELYWNDGSTTTLEVTNSEFFYTNGVSQLNVQDSELFYSNSTSDEFEVSHFNSVLIAPSGDFTLQVINFNMDAAEVHRTQTITNKATGGDIGHAADTVDIDSSFLVNQTTAGQTLTLPPPTITTAGRVAYVNSIGTTSFTMLGKVLASGVGLIGMWNGSAWSRVGFGG